MEGILPHPKKTMALLVQGQIMETILVQANLALALTLKIMAMLTQGRILHPETILPLQGDTDTYLQIEVVLTDIVFRRAVEPNYSQPSF